MVIGGLKKLRIVSTPKGRGNKFADLWEHNADYSCHKVTIEDAVRMGLKVDVEQLKRGVDDPDIWAQEYMCEFIDNTSVLLPYEMISKCESESIKDDGASVTRAGDTRGVNPFLDFCEYQAKQILILATGGTLATLAEGDTGTLAGNAQENVWRQIVARDGGVISDALNRSLFRPYLAMAFPNRPTCVDFELGADKTPSAEDVFDLAAKARSAGYLIAQDELEEASGYTLEKDVQQPQNASMFGLARARDAATPFKNAKNALQNAPGDSDGRGEGESAPALMSDSV